MHLHEEWRTGVQLLTHAQGYLYRRTVIKWIQKGGRDRGAEAKHGVAADISTAWARWGGAREVRTGSETRFVALGRWILMSSLGQMTQFVSQP